MKVSLFDEIIRRLTELGIVRPEEIIGCTEDQIKEIKSNQQVTWLPPIYEDFLYKMGQYAGIYLARDPAFYYPWIAKAKSEAIEILKDEKAPLTLPDDAFVLHAETQGFEFSFFHVGQRNNDPPIYSYYETDDAFRLRWSSLSEFYRTILERVERNHQWRQSL